MDQGCRRRFKDGGNCLKKGIYNQVYFHSQQSVEKALKAFLVSQGKSYPRSHELTDLIASIPKNPLKSFEKI